MQTPKSNLRKGLILFVVAALFTFGFITLLQFTPVPWFFLVLVLMHAGIFSFILSKRLLKNTGFNTRTYFRRQYLLLLPYVAIMLYTFACRFGLLVMFADAKMVFTVAFTAVCIVFTVWNFLSMKKDLNAQLEKNPQAFNSGGEPEAF